MSALVHLGYSSSIDPAGLTAAYVPITNLRYSVTEGATFGPISVPDGTSAVDLPGIGSGSTEITTLTYFFLLAYGIVTINFNGADITLNGTVSEPAPFIVAKTSFTTIPKISNASGASVDVLYQMGGS